MNFCKVELIIICNHLEIYAKTISHFRLGEYRLVITSTSAANNVITRMILALIARLDSFYYLLIIYLL